MKNGQNSKNRCLIWRFWSWQGTLRVSGWMDFPFIFLSLSFVTSSLFHLQYREHDIFSGDFDLHLHHPISITPLLWRFRSSSSSSNLDHSIFSVRIERRICFVWRRSMTQDQSFWSGTEMGLIRLCSSNVRKIWLWFVHFSC